MRRYCAARRGARNGGGMARVVSVHEYELRAGIDPATFERAVRDAESRGLLRLPGLVGHHFLRGIKGARRDRYAAIWIYESREAWQRLWGTPEAPRRFDEYPETWRIWEEQVLAPLLTEVPDAIAFTAYEEV
jgi:heme-degrading monooxygenase HmoA